MNKYIAFLRAINVTSYVSFLKQVPDTALKQKLEAKSDGMDTFHVYQRELY